MNAAIVSCTVGASMTVGLIAAAIRVSGGEAAGRASTATLSSALTVMLRLARSTSLALPRFALPRPLRTAFDRQLARAGWRDDCDARTWLILLLLAGAGSAGAAALGVVLLSWPTAIVGAAAVGVPWVLESRLRNRAVSRAVALSKDLPAGIDLLILCLESGASLGAAMRIASEKQGTGPVQQLWGEVLAQVRSGHSRAVALRRVMERLDLAPVTALFTALIQADSRGMSLGAALRAQSAQCLADRFIRAERAALQAPVKLLFPLLTCIFPCTFIVIAVPIAARFIGMEAS